MNLENRVTGRSRLCLVIGDPISHSLSPAMHNAAYADAQIDFVMAAARVSAESLAAALVGVRALDVRGLSVTMPLKVGIIEHLDHLDSVAEAIGAVNTIVNNKDVLTGYNTDWLGIVNPLERICSLCEKRVAVLGAGGAALAAVFGCMQRGARVTVYNRNKENAQALAKRLGCECGELSDSAAITAANIIINTTAIGMAELADRSPLPAGTLRSNHIVFETIYAPYTTPLLQQAIEAGAQLVRGHEMFLEQGAAQFELHTGVKAPRAVMERIILAAAKA
jgi:shikimate dehydrogenase